jgi:hypothetical protein
MNHRDAETHRNAKHRPGAPAAANLVREQRISRESYLEFRGQPPAFPLLPDEIGATRSVGPRAKARVASSVSLRLCGSSLTSGPLQLGIFRGDSSELDRSFFLGLGRRVFRFGIQESDARRDDFRHVMAFARRFLP